MHLRGVSLCSLVFVGLALARPAAADEDAERFGQVPTWRAKVSVRAKFDCSANAAEASYANNYDDTLTATATLTTKLAMGAQAVWEGTLVGTARFDEKQTGVVENRDFGTRVKAEAPLSPKARLHFETDATGSVFRLVIADLDAEVPVTSFAGGQATTSQMTWNGALRARADKQPLPRAGTAIHTTISVNDEEPLANGVSTCKYVKTVELKLDPVAAIEAQIDVSPPSPERGERVTVNASGEGATQFQLTVTPRPCPSIGLATYDAGMHAVPVPPLTAPAKQRDDKTWAFRALCDFQVKLHVSDGKGHSADATKDVAVRPRGWSTHWSHEHESFVDAEGTIAQGHAEFGKNRCASEPTTPIATDAADRWVHARHGSKGTDYSESFHVATVDDDGPFAKLAYADSQTLVVDRRFYMNPKIKPGGAFYKLNERKGNGAAAARLFAQTKAHEAMHSTLAQRALAKQDPAKLLEAFVAENDDTFRQQANARIAEVDQAIADAANEAHVAEALKRDWSQPAIFCLDDVPYPMWFGAYYTLGTPEQPTMIQADAKDVPKGVRCDRP